MTDPKKQPPGFQVRNTEEMLSQSPKAGLFALTGEIAGHRYTIDKNVLIGRDPAADIQISGDDVSRRHASIWITPSGDFVIEDLHSRNGTLINGAPIEVHMLRFGDKIQIGAKTFFVFTHHHALEDQLVLWQRIELIAQMSAGIIHDFNNYMTALLGYIQYLNQYAKLAQTLDELQEVLAESLPVMESAANEGAILTQKVLGFARSARRPDQLLDLVEIINEAIRLVARNFPTSITIETDLQANLLIHGDRTEILQVLINLILNARDAMPQGGRLDIRGYHTLPTTSPKDTGAENKGEVVITVKDTGVGMDEKTMRQIFKPLFTTKEKGKGTGLGLSMVTMIVEYHHGHVQVESELGKGTIFHIHLPRAGQISTAVPTKTTTILEPLFPHDVAIRRGDGLVLLVDDGEVLKQRTMRVLYSLGYEVVIAANTQQALDLFAQYFDRTQLVIINCESSAVDAIQICRKVVEIEPTTRVLVTSNQKEDILPAIQSIGVQKYLHSSYDTQTFSSAVIELLNDPSL